MSAFLARPPAGFAAPSRMKGRPPRKPAPAGLLKYFTPISPSQSMLFHFHINTLRKTLNSRVHKSPLAFATIRAIDPTSSVPDTCTILPAAGSQKPPSLHPTMSSSHMDMDDPETLLEGSQKTPKKTPKKPLQYPADIPRLTRFGRGTYGVKTGPLPDGTDWSKLSVDIIKEQLMMRNVPTDGRKQVLVNRLQNWQTYYDGQTVDVRPVAEGFDPADEGASSTPKSTKKQRNGVPVNDHRHIMSTKKAMTQRMYIIKQYTNDEWGNPNRLSLAVRGAGDDMYTVTIAHETSCTCSAAKFNPRSNCKHVIWESHASQHHQHLLTML
ncbi:ring finger domain protein [Colletotrichum chrysophilum]|uniref:Ring finger domain protein n=1 Tax=Colletotrichum chrysophilum TaxID=1836956 RepID=A0AAD9AWM8_9PEZI|nr:ring finger domain protein [Colletotrichum chrysophilum]